MKIANFWQGVWIREEIVNFFPSKEVRKYNFFLPDENTISSRIRNGKKISFLLVLFRNCYKCVKFIGSAGFCNSSSWPNQLVQTGKKCRRNTQRNGRQATRGSTNRGTLCHDMRGWRVIFWPSHTRGSAHCYGSRWNTWLRVDRTQT